MSKIVRSKVESKSQLAWLQCHRCRCWCQRSFDQKLKANHNWNGVGYCRPRVDVKDRSIKSWKQITTRQPGHPHCPQLMSKIVRSKVESKSQQKHVCTIFKKSWCQRSFDQKLKANHNPDSIGRTIMGVDVKDRSIKSWKQITTWRCYIAKTAQLMSKIVRSKVESKSQRSILWDVVDSCWCQRSFDQKLKANHNTDCTCWNSCCVDVKDRSIKSWKQITTKTLPPTAVY